MRDSITSKGSKGDSYGKHPNKPNTNASSDQHFKDGFKTLDADEGYGRRGLTEPVEYTDLHSKGRFY